MPARSILAAAVLVVAGSHAASAADGARLFAATCQACHQAGGVGAPGLAPPLLSPVLANAASRQKDYPALVVINGLSGPLPLAGGGSLTSAMPPPQGLGDDDIAAVVNYVYRLNHAKTTITSADVARLRGQPADNGALKRIRAQLMP
jgi:mono/diheme cytochrome c family protein